MSAGASTLAVTAVPPSLEIRLLGPTEIRVDGAPVGVGGTMQRATLAMLVLAAGTPVSAADLIAGLWGDAPPRAAATTVRAYVSRLRTGVAAGRLERGPAGYVLDVPRDSVDVLRFRSLADDAGTGEDVAALDAALSLWRGPALADVRDLPFAGPVVAGLEAARTRLRDRRFDALVAGGRGAEVLDELQALSAAAPHDEPIAVLLMRALAHAGRHTEALAAYDALRLRLAEDLGVDPGPAARAVHAAVLVHDPAVVGAGGVTGTATDPAPIAGMSPVPVDATPPPAPGPTGNLPLPLTAFVGREAEIASVHTMLAEARLLTLTGAGGCGKTRLAVEACRRLASHDTEGPWLVELAGVEDAALVPTAVAQTLGITTASATSTAEAVVAALHGRRTLVLLDNCEHLVDDVAAFVQRFLATCPGVRVLATSREPLGVPGERVLTVPPMTVGRDGRDGEAERLFLDRARGLLPDLALDDVAGPLVRHVCAALDGIPLAIELAAARLNVLSLEAIAGGLDDRFALLTHGSRTALPRHRTLAAAIEWSHDLLTGEEQSVFAAASAFRASFELEDLAAVHGAGAAALVPIVGALVDKSMVVTDPSVTGTRRYRLLETLRAFVQHRLAESERTRLADAHAARLAARVEDAAGRLRSFDDAPAWRWLDAARPDVRAALEHTASCGSPSALRLVAGLGWYWYRRGFVREGLRWTARVEPMLPTADPLLAARVRLGRIALRYLAGDAEGLQADMPGLAEAAAASGDPTVQMIAHIYLGYFEAAFGDPTVAGRHLDDALTLAATETPADWARAEVAMTHGQFLRATGRPVDAVRVLREGQAMAAACGHRWGAGSIGWVEAKAHLDLGDAASAARILVPSFRAFLGQGDRTSTLAAVHTMAAVAAGLERHADGARLLGAVDAHGERTGYSPLRMDPVDGQEHRRRVREALTPTEFDAAYAEGRRLGVEDVAALVRSLTA